MSNNKKRKEIRGFKNLQKQWHGLLNKTLKPEGCTINQIATPLQHCTRYLKATQYNSSLRSKNPDVIVMLVYVAPCGVVQTNKNIVSEPVNVCFSLAMFIIHLTKISLAEDWFFSGNKWMTPCICRQLWPPENHMILT